MSSHIAAPLLVLTCGVLRIGDDLDGERGHGPAWTVEHLAFLAEDHAEMVAITRGVRTTGPHPVGSGAVAGFVRTAGAQARPGSGTCTSTSLEPVVIAPG
ncbi:hypothetical protein G7043_25620 [Lentzea sp. NEAU-D13]|uniref:Uncharacterized protein n=1 Tax=Lentzea alba TaxID=2714351 RepID=A0A7C9RTK0_9PSEU|nr:hypothetical protein [Lentzea alba]NGY62307.1 hypothetical protein [Lentzea alba]